MQNCKNKKPVCAFSKLRPYAVFDKISLQRLQRTESEKSDADRKNKIGKSIK